MKRVKRIGCVCVSLLASACSPLAHSGQEPQCRSREVVSHVGLSVVLRCDGMGRKSGMYLSPCTTIEQKGGTLLVSACSLTGKMMGRFCAMYIWSVLGELALI